MKKATFILIATGALAACSPTFNGPLESAGIAERHPITVDQQTISMTIAVDESLSELARLDKARLDAFADTYFSRGNGPVTITAPTGNSDDLYAQAIVADIRDHLHAAGFAYDALQGATYRAGPGDGEEIIVSFSGHVASASTCGVWDDEFERRSRNLTTKNFGCAQQNNLAAMIADPRDLVEPEAFAPTQGARQTVIRDNYIEGTPTSSGKDPNIAASSQ